MTPMRMMRIKQTTLTTSKAIDIDKHAAFFCCGLLISAVFCCFTSQAESLRDPTKPVLNETDIEQGQEESSSSSGFNVNEPFVLKSILFSKQRSVAVINGKAVKAGDSLGNATIKSISRDTVTLVSDKKPILLYLPSKSIKSSVKEVMPP